MTVTDSAAPHPADGVERGALPAPSPDPERDRARSRSRARLRRGRAGYFLGFGAPGLLFYACFVLAPLVLSLGYSLTNANGFAPTTDFVGLRNFTRLFQDPDFLLSLRVTTIMTLIIVIVPNLGGLGIAVLLNRHTWLYRALRSVFFVPVVLSSVVVSVVWQAMLTDGGLLDTVLESLGVAHPPGWLSDPDIALYSVAGIASWQLLGFCTVVYLAGLQGVPDELMEAAALDGAGPWARFRQVTWPMLAPALTINTVMLLITGFKTYDFVQVITAGGPGTGTTATVAYGIIKTGFTADKTGMASAMAVVMLVIVAVVSSVALRLLQRREVEL